MIKLCFKIPTLAELGTGNGVWNSGDRKTGKRSMLNSTWTFKFQPSSHKFTFSPQFFYVNS